MAVFFLFVDGIGVGDQSYHNPLATDKYPAFSVFTGEKGLHQNCKPLEREGYLWKPVDANLGVKGLPQSGTGQVSLFSGENASKLIGKHFGPYPYSKTKPLIEERSLFIKAQQLGFKPHFLNAYPDIFFKRSEKRDRWTCTTLMAKSAGLKLNGESEVINGDAVTAEIIQNAWREILGLNVPEITPETAAERVLKSLERYDLVLFEYYLTDKAGHEMNHQKSATVLTILNSFMDVILKEMKPDDTFVLCSDHGNIENLSVKTHTRNPVPLFVYGDTEPFRSAETILDVTPAIVECLLKGRSEKEKVKSN